MITRARSTSPRPAADPQRPRSQHGRLPVLAVGAAGLALVAAGCGSSSYSTSKSASPASTTSSASSPPSAGAYGSTKSTPASGGASSSAGSSGALTVHHGSLGTFITDAQGRTLYLFEKDKGYKSSCYGACANVWPPATTTGTSKVGTGLKASLLGTTKRADGSSELTYGGHPLYRYAGDQTPGDTKGQGLNQFGAKWYVVRPSGDKIDSD